MDGVKGDIATQDDDSGGGPSKTFKSKIPKLVTRSMDTPREVEEAKRFLAAAGGLQAIPDCSMEDSLNLERNHADSELRAPRYGLNKYASYDQMLDEMSQEDPFNRGTPPPAQVTPKPRIKKSINKEVIALDNIPTNAEPVKTKPPQRPKTIDDPKPIRTPRRASVREDPRTSSVASNATYVLERTDSKAKLVEAERSVSSGQVSSDSIKIKENVVPSNRKVLVDDRGNESQLTSDISQFVLVTYYFSRLLYLGF
ncbi:hypothetical protein CAPTEDRAFT_199954 [Capitella teleta]|uniref:Uncharacterized protein n=1 Tax=Capitella teleta TaxID=283909 RepID=R7TTT8_CAPTE|nr:hypothetical protein CAPTEDRAFT_199954 [Capitella teleta]|eukprot:ELT97298.1 hypothetical protein CAPTEDRAFT_199954 [Capitella teleta]